MCRDHPVRADVENGKTTFPLQVSVYHSHANDYIKQSMNISGLKEQSKKNYRCKFPR